MPRGDGTGPMGKGPFTGRAAGYCAGYPDPGYANSSSGTGMMGNAGMGRGRGYRRMLRFFPFSCFGANVSYFQQEMPADENREPVPAETIEKNEIKAMKAQIDYITKSLAVVTEKLECISKSVEKTV